MAKSRPFSPRSDWAAAGQIGGIESHVDDVGTPRDPCKGEVGNQLHIDNHGRFNHGLIIASFPFLRSYYVQLHGEQIPRTCVSLTTTSLDVFGMRESAALTPLTPVLVYVPTHSELGWIVGTLPGHSYMPAEYRTDMWIVAGRAGFQFDPAFNAVVKQLNNGLVNASNWRNVDELPGDWSISDILGSGIYAGQGLVTLRGSDLSRLDLFHMDDLVRLFAYNMEHFGAGYERLLFDDHGEISDLEMWTPFPHEASGIAVDRTLLGLKSGGFAFNASSLNGGQEPVEAQAEGIWRLRRFRGFLGDLEHVIASCPHVAGRRTLLAGVSNPANRDIGLFESVVGPDGTFLLRSAKQIFLSKDVLIPVPIRLRTAIDPEGDGGSSDDYTAAGESGDRRDFPLADATKPGCRATQLNDVFTHATNQAVATLDKHKKDWLVEQPGEIPLLDSRTDNSYQSMESVFALDSPIATSQAVDHRFEIQLHRGRSIVALCDDGSIVTECAYGSQIRQGGGNIELTCPGDIILRPGRNLIVMSPHDAVIRAGNSVDVTAGQRDVRLKAERNVQVLAGNSGEGGILLESRSTGDTFNLVDQIGEDVTLGGVAIRCRDSSFVALTDHTYIKSAGRDIVLDSADEGRSLILTGASVTASVRDALTVIAGGALNNTSATRALHVLGANGSVLAGPIQFVGQVVSLNGGLTVDGSIFATGSVAGQSVGQADISAETRQSLETAKSRIAATLNDFKSTLGQYASLLYDTETGFGNGVFATNLAVTLRTDAQYGLEGDASFVLWEAPWQRKARANSSTKVWHEPAVLSPAGEETYPYPGLVMWQQEARYAQVDSVLFDDREGRPHNRDVELSVTNVSYAKLSAAYVITKQ